MEVGVILPTDVCHLPLEAMEFVPKIVELRLNDGLLCKLLTKKLPHLVGLEKETLTDITNRYPEKKPYLGFFLSEHPPQTVNHVQIGPSLERGFISGMCPYSLQLPHTLGGSCREGSPWYALDRLLLDQDPL